MNKTHLILLLFCLLAPLAQAQAPAMRQSEAAATVANARELEGIRKSRRDLLQNAQGILVVSVETGSQADGAGIQPGDVVVRYGSMPVSDATEFVTAVAQLSPTVQGIDLLLIRSRQQIVARLKAGKIGVGVVNVAALDGDAASGAASPPAASEDQAQLFAQLGHASAGVSSVAVSPDGRWALSGGWDSTVKLWDIASGREIRTFAGHSDAVISVAFSPNGRLALSGSRDGSWRLWEVASGRSINSAKAHAGGVNAIAFSPDGRQALTGGDDQKVKLWDLASATHLRSMIEPPGHGGLVNAVAFSPDGRHALSTGSYTAKGSWSEQVRYALKLWDIATGQNLRVMTGHADPVKSIAFSPNGRHALSGSSDKTARLWDLESGQELRILGGHGLPVDAVAFSPDGRQALSAGGELKLWDTATGSEIREFRHQGQEGTLAIAAAFSPDGRQALSSHLARGMFVWDIATGTPVRQLHGHSSHLYAVAFSPDGKRVATGARSMDLWDIVSGKRTAQLSDADTGSADSILANLVRSIAFSPDGRLLLSGLWGKTLQLRDAGTGHSIRSFSGHSGAVMSIAFSRDGRLALSSGGYGRSILGDGFDKTLRLWDIASGENIRSLTAREPVQIHSAALSPDGTKALSAGTREITLWDLASGTALRSFSGAWTAAALSPDGRHALAASALDKGIKLLDLGTGQELRSFKGHANFVKTLAFSPDGTRALSGGRDNLVKLWDIASGKELHTLKGHSGVVTSLAFSPDGRLALSGSEDATARLWDLASGRQLVQLIAFDDGEWISITPEGYFAASSPKAAAHLNIRQGTKVYGIDQFYDVFYRPDIVEAALAGQDTTRLAALSIDAAIRQPPPLVERIEVPAAGAAATLKVAYRIQSAGGGIGEVRVFHNGKLIRSDAQARPLPPALLGRKAEQLTGETLAGQMRSLAATPGAAPQGAAVSAPKPDTYEASVDIEPVPGDNDIAVVAFNAQNSIQSPARTASFTSTRPPVAPRLHILAIGIDEYKDPAARLAFAGKDARDLAARWLAQARPLYGEGKVVVDTLTNAQASRAAILARIDRIAAQLRPTDHFLLFVASHGVLLGEQYAMVTHDYDGKLQPEKLITAAEIVDFSKRIKALSQLYILDTCHAGGLEGVVSGLYDARVSVLAKKMGLHVFASASSTQEALDGFQGNGLFTHTLLAGLDNNPLADGNADRQVSVMELGSFSRTRTHDLAARLKHRQEPLILHFGQDRAVYKLP